MFPSPDRTSSQISRKQEQNLLGVHNTSLVAKEHRFWRPWVYGLLSHQISLWLWISSPTPDERPGSSPVRSVSSQTFPVIQVPEYAIATVNVEFHLYSPCKLSFSSSLWIDQLLARDFRNTLLVSFAHDWPEMLAYIWPADYWFCAFLS